jgi:hypothetical protein
MFKGFMVFLAALVISQVGIAQQNNDDYIVLSGSILDVQIGEADPFVWGDVCIIELKAATQNIGLVTDVDECLQNEEDLIKGRQLDVVVLKKDQVLQKDKISLLLLLSNASAFYSVDFGAVENGLADLTENPPITEEGERIVVPRSRFVDFLCQQSDGRHQYEAAVIFTQYNNTGYEVMVTEVGGEGLKRVVTQEEAKLIKNGQATVYVSESTQLLLNQSQMTASLKLKQSSVSMTCKKKSILTYDDVIILEPRVSVGN